MIVSLRNTLISGLLCLSFLLPGAVSVAQAEGSMMSTDFTMNMNNLSPSEQKYEGGAKANIRDLLGKVGTLLLIVIPMLAVLFIVVGGIMMVTASMWGKDGQFSKGKTIITFNITALVLSLTSYSIMQFVTWALWIK